MTSVFSYIFWSTRRLRAAHFAQDDIRFFTFSGQPVDFVLRTSLRMTSVFFTFSGQPVDYAAFGCFAQNDMHVRYFPCHSEQHSLPVIPTLSEVEGEESVSPFSIRRLRRHINFQLSTFNFQFSIKTANLPNTQKAGREASPSQL